MTQVPDDLLYTEKHEWVRVQDDVATIGITDYAQDQLGDIVYVELPEAGSKVAQMEAFGTIEAVKAVSDLYSPVSGEVIEVNEALRDDPTSIKSSPYGEGWMIKVKMSNQDELATLLQPDKYRELVGG